MHNLRVTVLALCSLTTTSVAAQAQDGCRSFLDEATSAMEQCKTLEGAALWSCGQRVNGLLTSAERCSLGLPQILPPVPDGGEADAEHSDSHKRGPSWAERPMLRWFGTPDDPGPLAPHKGEGDAATIGRALGAAALSPVWGLGVQAGIAIDHLVEIYDLGKESLPKCPTC